MTKGRKEMKVSFAIVCIDAFRVRCIVADDDVEVAIAVDVRESYRVRAIRDITEIVC